MDAELAAAVERVTGARALELTPMKEREWERNHVFRARLDDGRSVIAKRGKRWEGQKKYPPRGFYGDFAGVRFLAAVAPEIAPKYIGGEPGSMYVLGDLGDTPSLADLLQGKDADAASHAIEQLGAALGRMHAATAGQEQRWEGLYAEVGGAKKLETLGLVTADNIEKMHAFCDRVGVAWPDVLDAELADLPRLDDPDRPFRAYVHGDPCPDNCRVVDGNMILIDFEVSQFANIFTDAAYARITFPSCWCTNRLPRDLVTRFEAAWRTEVVPVFAALDDDATFEREMQGACAAWLIDTIAPLAAADEENVHKTWGIATHAQRTLMRLESFAANTFPVLTTLAGSLAATLRKRWPDVDEMPLYPALRN